MRQHPKWTDGAYWQGIAERLATLAEREREKQQALDRRRSRIAADVERFLARQRGEVQQ